jgi:hypothetical protein
MSGPLDSNTLVIGFWPRRLLLLLLLLLLFRLRMRLLLFGPFLMWCLLPILDRGEGCADTARCIRATGDTVKSQSVSAVSRVQQGRVLQMPEGNEPLGRISLSQQARGFAIEYTSAISGFRSLRGPKQRSSLSLRARHDQPF